MSTIEPCILLHEYTKKNLKKDYGVIKFVPMPTESNTNSGFNEKTRQQSLPSSYLKYPEFFEKEQALARNQKSVNILRSDLTSSFSYREIGEDEPIELQVDQAEIAQGLDTTEIFE